MDVESIWPFPFDLTRSPVEGSDILVYNDLGKFFIHTFKRKSGLPAGMKAWWALPHQDRRVYNRSLALADLVDSDFPVLIELAHSGNRPNFHIADHHFINGIVVDTITVRSEDVLRAWPLPPIESWDVLI